MKSSKKQIKKFVDPGEEYYFFEYLSEEQRMRGIFGRWSWFLGPLILLFPDPLQKIKEMQPNNWWFIGVSEVVILGVVYLDYRKNLHERRPRK